MILKCLCVIPLLVSVSSFAGNPLDDQCDGQYKPNVTIQSINVISNLALGGPGMNVKINGQWYAKYFSDNADKGFYQLAYMAYVSGTPINACVNSGQLRGLEFY